MRGLAAHPGVSGRSEALPPRSSCTLALERVMLSSGGLGCFEYEATVDGDATLSLTMSPPQVDDLVKSLVVYGDKGGVGGLSLPGRGPLAQAFKDLPFDQDALGSPADLLATLRGAEVSVGGRISAESSRQGRPRRSSTGRGIPIRARWSRPFPRSAARA